MDIAVIDDTGVRVAVASVPWTWFRGRISAGESDFGQMGPLHLGVPNTTVAPDEVISWTMEPPHYYIVNVGMWAFTDRSTGIGGAAAESQVGGTVTNIWVAWEPS